MRVCLGVRGRLIGFAALLPTIGLLLAACISMPPPTGVEPASTVPQTETPPPQAPPTEALPDRFANPPFRKSFGPAFAANPPGGDLQRIEGALLARDHRTLFVSFTGGEGFNVNDACSADYQAWVGAIAGNLEIQVSTVNHPEQRKPGPNQGCGDVGYGYLFRLLLPEPVGGNALRDRASGPLWVPRPEAIAELQPIPTGWQLANVTTTAAPRELWRDYGPGPDAGPGAADRTLAIFQVMNAPADHEIDAPFANVMIRGQSVPIGHNGPDGLIANWRLDTDGMTLTVIDANLTLEAFVAMANAVAVPAP